jgi:hypothetical protein
MSSLLEDIRHRKDFGPGRTATRGERAVYSDPAGGVVHAAETDSAVTWFVVSTEQIDRDGDTVSCHPDAWELDNYATNPVWIYDHGESDSRPIGLCRSPETGELLMRFETVEGSRRVLAGVYWDSGPWGQEIKGLVDRGLLRTASIGFLPKDGRPISRRPGLPSKQRKDAWDITRLEILELTITPTPSNTDALRLAISRGELSPVVTKSVRKALGMLADTSGGVLGGEGAEGEPGAEKHVDEAAEFKSALEDCVGRKVQVLVGEGKDEKQALAIAYSMCGEEHTKALNGDGTTQDVPDDKIEKDKSRRPCPNCNGKAADAKVNRMDTAAAADTGVTGVQEPESDHGAELNNAPVEPHGVTVSKNCLEHIKALLDYLEEQGLPGMEPDSAIKEHIEAELQPVLQEVAAALHETASEHYPDHDFGEAPEVAEDGEPIPDEGDEGDEEEVETEGDGDSAMEAAEESEKPEDDKEGEAKSESGEDEAEGMGDDEEKKLAGKYARSARMLVKHYRRKAYRFGKAAREVCVKACGHMTKAADHLDESSEDEGVEEHKSYMHKGHAAMLRKSAADVSRAVGGHEEGGDKDDMPDNGDTGDDQPEEAPDKEEKGVDWTAVLGEVASMRKSLDHARGKK